MTVPNIDHLVPVYVHTRNAGFGDTIQLTQIMGRVASVYKQVIFNVQPEIRTLIEASLSYIENLQVVSGVEPSKEYMEIAWYQLLDKPPRKPSGAPFLRTGHDDLHYLDTNKLNVGFCWLNHEKLQHSNHATSADVMIGALKQIKNSRLFSLKPDGVDHVQDAEVICTRFADFLDTATLVKRLDYVVTIDCVIAHLAAGLGVKTYVVVPENHRVRYYDDSLRDHDRDVLLSPWYRSMEIIESRKAPWTINDPNSLQEGIHGAVHYIRLEEEKKCTSRLTPA